MLCCKTELIAQYATILGVIATVASAFWALKQYREERNFKKASFFIELRERFKNNSKFNNIRRILENGENINSIIQTDKYDYVGFFEELQIAINSKYISPELVYYLFGYYIIQCDRAQLINRELQLWRAFKQLADKMSELDNNFQYSNKLKF
ncbi:MAG: hypothetical protein EBQ94_11200 [Flavobacteriales bacterium]|nr:hypothetical protein [Crocinitomicaceae bacterium]NBX80922.1 hypothetical protein [Flavobacteriales bacterium]NCA20081.1 hypothetical protein [Crocinitomicaceae bacterium]